MENREKTPGLADPGTSDRVIAFTVSETHWIISALTDALSVVPQDHPDYPGIRFAIGIIRERWEELDHD